MLDHVISVRVVLSRHDNDNDGDGDDDDDGGDNQVEMRVMRALTQLEKHRSWGGGLPNYLYAADSRILPCQRGARTNET